jgi:hypothetical protein
MNKQEAKEKMIKDEKFNVNYYQEKLDQAKANLRVLNDSPEQMSREEILKHIRNLYSEEGMSGEFSLMVFCSQMRELVRKELKITEDETES